MLSLIDFAEIPFFMSLPFVAPPGVPADRAKALQEAFMAMCRDKGVLEEGEKLGIEMSPIDADEILRLVGAHGGDAERGDRALQRARRREGEVAQLLGSPLVIPERAKRGPGVHVFKRGHRSGVGSPLRGDARMTSTQLSVTPSPARGPACGSGSAAACRGRCR